MSWDCEGNGWLASVPTGTRHLWSIIALESVSGFLLVPFLFFDSFAHSFIIVVTIEANLVVVY